jgi:hypothetical protein
MNQSSTSSFIGYLNGTSSGGNNTYLMNSQRMFFLDNGNILIPNLDTINAIFECQKNIVHEFDSFEDVIECLND